MAWPNPTPRPVATSTEAPLHIPVVFGGPSVPRGPYSMETTKTAGTPVRATAFAPKVKGPTPFDPDLLAEAIALSASFGSSGGAKGEAAKNRAPRDRVIRPMPKRGASPVKRGENQLLEPRASAISLHSPAPAIAPPAVPSMRPRIGAPAPPVRAQHYTIAPPSPPSKVAVHVPAQVATSSAKIPASLSSSDSFIKSALVKFKAKDKMTSSSTGSATGTGTASSSSSISTPAAAPQVAPTPAAIQVSPDAWECSGKMTANDPAAKAEEAEEATCSLEEVRAATKAAAAAAKEVAKEVAEPVVGSWETHNASISATFTPLHAGYHDVAVKSKEMLAAQMNVLIEQEKLQPEQEVEAATTKSEASRLSTHGLTKAEVEAKIVEHMKGRHRVQELQKLAKEAFAKTTADLLTIDENLSILVESLYQV